MKKKSALTIICYLLLLVASSSILADIQVHSTESVVYYAFGQCACIREYFENVESALSDYDFNFHLERSFDKIEEAKNRLYKELNVPGEMQGKYLLSINDKFLFINEVPAEIVADFMMNHSQLYPSIVVYNTNIGGGIDDRQENDGIVYKILFGDGSIVEGRIRDSFSDFDVSSVTNIMSLSFVPVVFFSGLLDGINPCAFAVLFFFIAFLYLARERSEASIRRSIFITGSIYIAAVYTGYLLIGLAVIKVATFSSFPHLFSLIGAALAVLFGLVNLKDYFWPGRGFSLKIPKSAWKTIATWMHKATIPSTIVVGLLVSVVEFPCTGGIYLAILGMLADTTTFTTGFLYLLLYNVAFVFPLIIILVFSNNKTVMTKMREWILSKEREMRLVTGLGMILLGLILFFTGSA